MLLRNMLWGKLICINQLAIPGVKAVLSFPDLKCYRKGAHMSYGRLQQAQDGRCLGEDWRGIELGNGSRNEDERKGKLILLFARDYTRHFINIISTDQVTVCTASKSREGRTAHSSLYSLDQYLET